MPRSMRGRKIWGSYMRGWLVRSCAAAVFITMAVAPSVVAGSAGAAPGHTSIPSAVPGQTPNVSDGKVNAIARVGDVVVLGGTFTAATPASGGASVPRSKALAFNASTGQISASFAPDIDGEVLDLEPGPTPGTVYAVGRFSKVNGATYNKAVLLDVATGAPVSSFRAVGVNGVINSAVLKDNRLFIGGYFTKVNGETHAGIASLDARSGAVDPYVSNQVAERHNTGAGAQGGIGVQELDIAPSGDRLVAIGNFRFVDGLDRDQVVMLTLGQGGSSVTEDWQTNRYKPLCYSWSFDSYVRGVDFSPDGSYFVVASTGGYGSGTLCDAAARFETYTSGAGQQPTWVNYTGGDTLWAVEVTETAVYVGGHQRWMNNSFAADRAGAGAVPRPGLAALSTTSGLPLKWNPGRNPRGAAVYDIQATGDGLYIGSDTEYIGNRQYRRARIAYFPLAGGAKEAKDTPAKLPGTVLVGGTSSLKAASFDGTTAGGLTTVDALGFNWRSARAAFVAGGKLYYAATDGKFYRRAFNGTSLGSPEALTPWSDPAWAGVPTGSGSSVYTGAASNFYSQIPSVTSLTYANGRIYYTLSNRTNIYSRWFNVDSGVVGADEFTHSSHSNWRLVSSSFIGGGNFYFVASSTGALYSVPLSSALGTGTAAGATLVNNQDMRGTTFLISNDALANEPPVAKFTETCTDLSCTFDSSTSTDPDGSIASYQWDFGDGTTSDQASPAHTFAAANTYAVSLTVTDNRGETTTVTKNVTVVDTAGASIAYVGAAAASPHSQTPSVTAPAEVQPGDTLLLSLAVAADLEVPDPAGWTRVGRKANGAMATYLWTKTATAADASGVVSLALPQKVKTSIAVTAYRGANQATPVAVLDSATTVATTTHVSPSLTAPAGSLVVSIWSDKSPEPADWVEPAGTQVRAETVGVGAGRMSLLVVDGGAAQGGPVGGLTATTDITSSRGVSWTIALAPQ